MALLVAACAGPLSMNLVDPDLWGHVRYGQDWLADGALPRTATHTYTAEGHPWINHENLAELLLTTGFATIGTPGMLAAKCLLGLAVLGAMASVARRRRVRPVTAWAFFLLIALNLHAFWLLRPQLLSFLLCGLMLLVLERATAGWGDRRSDFQPTRRKSDPAIIDWRWLAAMPLLFAVWANSHGGFLAGLAVFETFLAGRAIELLVRRGREAWRMVAGLAAVGVACGLATFANPYGVGLHGWLAASLGSARPEITEWAPPALGNPVFWPFVSLVLVAVGSLLWTERRRDPVRVVILLLVGWQAASHLRHIAFFALLCGFWLPPHVQSVVSRLRGGATRGLPRVTMTPGARRVFAGILLAAVGLQTFGVTRRLMSFPVEKARYPVDALAWMDDHAPRGKLVVCFNWAQYAIAALAPDVRVSFDGRFRTCYPQDVVDMNFDFLMGDRGPRARDAASGPIDGSRVLRHGEPDYVLVDRDYWNAVGVMIDQAREASPAWALVYQDGISQVWGRRSVVDDPASDRYVAEGDRLVSDDVSGAIVEWPALPRTNNIPTGDDAPGAVARRQPAAAPRDGEG